jgi:hypothetical protein
MQVINAGDVEVGDVEAGAETSKRRNIRQPKPKRSLNNAEQGGDNAWRMTEVSRKGLSLAVVTVLLGTPAERNVTREELPTTGDLKDGENAVIAIRHRCV